LIRAALLTLPSALAGLSDIEIAYGSLLSGVNRERFEKEMLLGFSFQKIKGEANSFNVSLRREPYADTPISPHVEPDQINNSERP
jgi:hypothetical protein